MRCSLCEHPAVFGPFGALHVCTACARVVARIANRSQSGGWRLTPERRSDEVEPSVPTEPDVDVEKVFRRFREGVRKQIAVEDVDSHLALATAYREMGLVADAVREAATAFEHASDHARKNDALSIVLDPRLLQPDALGYLRRWLTSN